MLCQAFLDILRSTDIIFARWNIKLIPVDTGLILDLYLHQQYSQVVLLWSCLPPLDNHGSKLRVFGDLEATKWCKSCRDLSCYTLLKCMTYSD